MLNKCPHCYVSENKYEVMDIGQREKLKLGILEIISVFLKEHINAI